jgi:hypothetical protein
MINTLASCNWIRAGEPLCLIGDSGTGKSHLLIGLGTAAAQAGFRVRYVLASKLVNELVEAADERQLTKTIARYGRVDLLCIDELGYMELDRRGAEMLFQVLTEREERNSIAIASNEAFSGWTRLLRPCTPWIAAMPTPCPFAPLRGAQTLVFEGKWRNRALSGAKLRRHVPRSGVGTLADAHLREHPSAPVRTSGSLDDVAERTGSRLGKRPGLLHQRLKLAAHPLQASDVLRECPDALFHQIGDVGAGRLAADTEGKDLSDLAKGKPDRLCSLDERKALEGIVAIVPVAARGPARIGQEPDVLVVADRLRRQIRLVAELADAHDPILGAVDT